MNKAHAWPGFGFVSLLAVLGCSRGELQSAQTCEPGVSECVSDRLARVCPEDGAGYLAFQCAAEETCQAGACVGPCQSGASSCISKDVLRICTADGKASSVVACPVGSECANGRCNAIKVKPLCAAGEWACATSTVGKECDSDGKSWVMTPCALGERCSFDAGSPRCVLDPTAPACKPGSSVCVDSDTALHCSRDGSGYSVQSCPPTAPCVEGGCRGPVCTVGESRCQGFPNPPLRDVVLNCRDGESWEQVTCAPQELCVFDGIAPGDAPALANWWGSGQGQPPPVPLPFPLTASCQPSNCLPFSGSYALAMCGDPTDPAHDSNQYLSRCEGYPPFSGYAWVPYRCPEPTECVTPRSSAVSAYCGSSCLPGDVRCSGNRLGLETCGGSGEWDAAPEACENGRLCAINEGTAACIDPECAYFMLQEPGNGGRCETVSAFRPCGRDGLLRDVDPTCKHCEIAPSAVFVPPVLPSYRPGTCTGPMGDDQCKLGDRYCTSTDQYWECEGPDWSGAELHRCPAGNQCFVTIDPLSGASRATCAECEPLSAACNEDGSIAYCDRNGRLQGPSPCPVGTCQWGIRPDGSNGFGCRTQCVPGAIQCVSPTQYQKCGVDGRFGPTSFTCENGNLCHLGGDGTTDVGCVQCAGPSHDRTRSASGLPDSRCVGNALSECQLDDTWGPPHECTDNTQCQQAGTGEDGTWVWANCAAL